jgi:hypothetical protein
VAPSIRELEPPANPGQFSAEPWRRLRAIGFRGSLWVVGEWATRRRRTEKAADRQFRKVPAAQTIARQMTIMRDDLTKADCVTIAAIEATVPALAEAGAFVERFNTMIRRKIATDLDAWIMDAKASSPRSP